MVIPLLANQDLTPMLYQAMIHYFLIGKYSEMIKNITASRMCNDMHPLKARTKTFFSQSDNLFTLSNANQNTQKTIENEEKITFHLGRKQRPNHRALAVEKDSSHKKLVRQVVFCFSRGNFYTFR